MDKRGTDRTLAKTLDFESSLSKVQGASLNSEDGNEKPPL